MDIKEEFHDPDYPEACSGARDEHQSTSADEKADKIRRIVRREFTHELELRENDIMIIDQRSLQARRMLQRLRYALVNNYYNEEKLKLSSTQIQDEIAAQTDPRAQASVSTILRGEQRRLPPSVRKLLGKQSSAVELQEILFASRAPRNTARKDYSAMLQTRKESNATNTPNSTQSANPTEPPSASVTTVKPRRLQPELPVLTVNAATRNQSKHRYRIIIGNTSKYAPPASSVDKSTHKWLLYVRGPPNCPTLGFVKGVTVKLHHSYAPHHTLHLDKPPFHVSRRGWGEFPAKIELHFALPERNRPVTVEHTIKLDRNYTGFQTLGAETVVEVWLYSTEEMLQYEYKEEDEFNQEQSSQNSLETTNNIIETKQESDTVIDNSIFENNDSLNNTENWLDFFSNTTEMDVDEMIIKPEKKPEERNDIESIIDTNVIGKEDFVKQINLEQALKIKQEVLELQYNKDNENDVSVNNSVTDINNVTEINNIKNDDLLDMPNELLTQPTSPKKRIMKYMDPTTGKIYYLEMDRNLDLSKVQEIVINSKGNIKTAKISPIKPNGLKNVRKTTKKGGMSLLKPEIKSLLKNETVKPQTVPQRLPEAFTHIENDHCYLGPAPFRETEENCLSSSAQMFYEEVTNIKQEKSVYENIVSGVLRLNSVKISVDWCLKKVPLVSSEARDPDYVQHFPFVVETEEKYWKLDFAKRRNLEWSRAKFINNLLTEHLNTTEPIWRTKQILIYSRLHGYYPVRQETEQKPTINENDWSSWTNFERSETELKDLYPNVNDICTLTKFDENEFNQNLSESLEVVDSDEEVDIVKWEEPVKVKKEMLSDSSQDLPVLPVLDPDERLRFLFLERKCADIGIELRNEDVGSGYSYSCVHAVLLSAMKSFAEELIRSSLAAQQMAEGSSRDLTVWQRCPPRRPAARLGALWRAAAHSRLHVLSARATATDRVTRKAL